MILIQRWLRNRKSAIFCYDTMRPRGLRLTTFSLEQEAIIIAFRKYMLLPLNELCKTFKNTQRINALQKNYSNGCKKN